MPKKRLFDDWDGQPLPPHVIESLNRQIREGQGMPTLPAEEVLKILQQKLQEIEDAQSRGELPGERAVA